MQSSHNFFAHPCPALGCQPDRHAMARRQPATVISLEEWGVAPQGELVLANREQVALVQ